MMNTVILRTSAKVLVPLALVFAMFIYFKGHQTPGGGFVGGLVASVALIVHRMSQGARSMNRMLPVPERLMIATGLLLAVGTGAGAMLFGLPFFTSAHGYLHLPPVNGQSYDFAWATVMAFDFGVFLVVTGVVVGIINTISEELEICHMPEEYEE
jgi:multicomponent Na+:H+ antiporter subunit B